MPRLSSGQGSNPKKDLRLDPMQLDWVEAYALTHGLNFSSVVRLAISKMIECEFVKMGKLSALCDILDKQIREFQALALQVRIATGPVDREIVTKHEREMLYDQAINTLHTLLEIAESKEASLNPEIKIQALLAANALTRTAEAIMNDYERGITKSTLQQMRDYVERLKQASRESNS